MTRLAQFFSNKVLWATLIAWLVSQMIKTIVMSRRERRFDFRWLFGVGGMPSAHSAGVAALATGVGLQMGFHTAGFAVALVFALVTMFDAQGVRRAAGRQARILNQILDEAVLRGRVSEQRLKELIGHTPVEVFAGGAIGILSAILICR